MPSITTEDFNRMRNELLFDGPEAARKTSRFWILLVLAGVIASAGVVADSTATVIGAMIVAPLMIPILGIVFSIVTGDPQNLLRSFVYLVAGATLVISIGWLFGQLTLVDIEAANNSQVAGRVNPRVIDLVAALATGAVGAFALSRSDVSDTLPGVAIAISLVPPLVVVGLTLEAGKGDESWGALLLFLTNVGSILLSGLVVMAIFRVFEQVSERKGLTLGYHGAQAAVLIFVILIAIPLGAASVDTTSDQLNARDVQRVAQTWAGDAGWRIASVNIENDAIAVLATGSLPEPDAEELRSLLDQGGLAKVDVQLTMVPETYIELPGD